jgi:hypothetical protein
MTLRSPLVLELSCWSRASLRDASIDGTASHVTVNFKLT